MLFEEIIPVYAENQNPQIQNGQELVVKAGGTYCSHWALNGYQ
jgi:hypothetical protein